MADYSALIDQAGQQFNVDPALIKAVMQQESGGNAKAVSGKGASGLMQLMPATAKALGVTDINDPQQNIFAGAKYLSQQLDKYKDPTLALAAYNAGPGNVDKAGGVPNFPETQNYVKNVMAAYTGTPATQAPSTQAPANPDVVPQKAQAGKAGDFFADASAHVGGQQAPANDFFAAAQQHVAGNAAPATQPVASQPTATTAATTQPATQQLPAW